MAMHGSVVLGTGDSNFFPHSNEDNLYVYLGHQNGKDAIKSFGSHSQEHVVSQETDYNYFQQRKNCTELTYLMEKLVTEQEKSLNLEGQVAILQKKLNEAQSICRAFSLGVFNSEDSKGSSCVNDGMSACDTGEVGCKATETCLTQLLLSDKRIKCSTAETQAWGNASLPQLVFMRKKLLSSLYGITDAIKRKRMEAIKADGVSEEIVKERDAEISAAMHRMLGEAFYVKSVKDTTDLHFFAESLSQTVVETFDAAVHDLKRLTDNEDILNSFTKLQEFISNSSLRFTSKWCKMYINIMRNLLVAFAISLQGNSLMSSRRAQLETLASQEVSLTMLLRAARGCDVLSPSTFFVLSDMNAMWRKNSSVPRPRGSTKTPNEGRVLTPVQKRPPSPRSASSPQRFSFFVKERWNSPRALPRRIKGVEVSKDGVSRGASVASSSARPPEEAPGQTRRRTADTLGLHPMYRKSSLGTSSPQLCRPSLGAAEGLRPFTPMRLRFASHKSYNTVEDSQQLDVLSWADGHNADSCRSGLKSRSRSAVEQLQRQSQPRRTFDSPHLLRHVRKVR